MNNNKQSSVEWLFEQIARRQGSILQTIPFYDDNQDLLQQAKAMHKEEIMQTLNDGKFMVVVPKENKSLEQYYNENFGGNK